MENPEKQMDCFLKESLDSVKDDNLEAKPIVSTNSMEFKVLLVREPQFNEILNIFDPFIFFLCGNLILGSCA